MWRPGNRSGEMRGRGFRDAGQQFGPARQRPGLLRRPAADLAVARPRCPISVGFLIRHARRLTFHDHLLLERTPVKTHRHFRVGGVAAAEPGEEIEDERHRRLYRLRKVVFQGKLLPLLLFVAFTVLRNLPLYPLSVLAP